MSPSVALVEEGTMLLCACGCGQERRPGSKYHVGHYPRTTEHRLLLSEVHLGATHSSETKERMRATHQEVAKSLDVARSRLSHNHLTTPERKLLRIIERHEIPLVYNGRAEYAVVDGKVPDFVNLEGRRAVEVSSLQGASHEDLELLPPVYEAAGWQLLILQNEDVEWVFLGPSENHLVNRLRAFLAE